MCEIRTGTVMDKNGNVGSIIQKISDCGESTCPMHDPQKKEKKEEKK